MNLQIPTRRRPPVAADPRRSARPGAPSALPTLPALAAPPGDDDEDAAACGWYASSEALRRGLVVTELERGDTVALQVPLGWWLQWQRVAAAGE